ncbi:MAG: hypothetical protein J6B72_00945 [Clostridia bacterium]|nr:hypothetical protein [Clostridia bacterium]
MTKYEILKNKFQNSELIVGTTIAMINNTLVVERMNRPDLDFILFDAEHGVFDAQNVIPDLQVCRLMGLPSIVRVQDSEYFLAAKLIDMGADGIMLPRTETLEQLRVAVDALLFSPVGRKGMGGHGQFRAGEKFADFPKTRFLLPQIESPKGIENLPAMLENYGEFIDAIMIGPYDMSAMVGTPQNITSPIMLESIQKVFDICKAHGKSCGIFCDDENKAQLFRDMGANVLWVATDNNFFMRGYNDMMNKVMEIK